MGIDRKYGRVTTEFGDIGEDEPVVVFRAQDGLLPKILMYYHLFCLRSGSPDFHLNLIMGTIREIQAWQSDPSHRVKNPPNSDGPAGQRLKGNDHG